jgi:hypothetical protein
MPPSGVGTIGELGAFARATCGTTAGPVFVGTNGTGAVTGVCMARGGTTTAPCGGIGIAGGGLEIGSGTPALGSNAGAAIAIVDSPTSSFGKSDSSGFGRSPTIVVSST